MSNTNAFINGEYLPLEKAFLNVEDRGTLFGDGIYEYIRISRGRIFLLEEHMKRFWRNAAEIEIIPPYSYQELIEAMLELVKRSAVCDACLYVQMTRGTAPRSHQFPENTRPNLFLFIRQLPVLAPSVYNNGVAMTLLPDERWKRCDIKSLNLLSNVLSKQMAKKKGFHDAILFNERGITESTSSSVIAIINGVLTVPPPGPWILPAITCSTVINIAEQNNLPTERRFISPTELLGATEVMLTGTSIGIVPVKSIDHSTIGDGIPGPAFELLTDKHNEFLFSQ